MTYYDRDPLSGARNLRTGRELESDPTLRASPRRAVWSAVTGIAIVFVLFIVFYGINARHESTTASHAKSPATTEATVGQASAPAAPQTTGQGGSRNEGAPTGEAAH